MKEGWTEKIWDEVLEIRSGRNQKEVEDPNGKFPIIGSAGKVMGYAKDYICEEGTTIVGRKGTINNPMLIDEKFWNVDTAFGLHAKENLDKRFLHYFCLSFDFTEMDRGSGRPSLVKSDLLKIKMLVPPLPEQQRIVAILDEAFAAIAKAKANAEQNLKNAKELFESYLQGVFEKKGDGWECKELMSVCEQITDGSHFSPKSTNEGEYPYITVRDIDNDLIDFTNCKFINETDYKSLLKNGCKPNNGDLLFSKDGTVGKVSLVDFEKDFVVLSSLAIIRPKKDKLDSVFLKYVLKNPLFLQKAIGMKTGVAIRRIILKNLKQIEISYPKSKEAQKTIVRQLDALRAETQKLEAVYQKKIADLEELKKSILQKAFKGELRGGEPAELETDTSASSVPVAYEINDNLSKAAEPDSIKDKNLN